MNIRFETRWLPLCLALLAAAPGCQLNRNRALVEDLNSEKRRLEDRVYDLAYENEILVDKLHRLEAAPNSRLRYSEDAAPRPMETLPNPRALEETRPAPGSGDGAPARSPQPADRGNPPPVDPPPGNPPPVDPPAIDPPGIDPPGDPGPNRQTRSGGVGPVASIRLNPLKTGSEDFDGLPGDDGVRVLIEPLGERGRFIAQPGAVSVVVLDPAVVGDRARVARWDLTAAEASETLQDTGPSRGLQLSLPWPTGTRLEHERLHLFVRYTAPDGRKLEADREFFANLPGGVAHRWTPRESAPRMATPGPANPTNPLNSTVANPSSPSNSSSPSNRSNAPGASGNWAPSVATQPSAGRSNPPPNLPAPPPRTIPPPNPPRPAATSTPLRQVERPEWRPVR